MNQPTMKAMVLTEHAQVENRPLRLVDVPIPEPGPGQIRVRVSACGICRTDLHVIEGELANTPLPIIPGHQIVGAVEKLGEGSHLFELGDRAGIAWLRGTDGTCLHCLRARENLCPNATFTGYHENGGYAEYAVVDETFAYSLPDSYADAEATPLLCAGIIGYRSLKRAAVPPGGKLLLIGFGSSAHIVIQLALHRGLEVFVVTREEKHREFSLKLGAKWAGPDFTDLPVKVDSAILFAPAGELVPPAMASLERGGILSIAGIHLSDVPVLNYERELFYEKEIRSVTANTRQDGHELLSEAVAAGIRPQISTYRLEDANEALIDLKHDRLAGTGVLVL